MMLRDTTDSDDTTNLMTRIGEGGQYLGIAPSGIPVSGDNTISNFDFFAIEFDTHCNTEPFSTEPVEWEDSSCNDHIAFLKNSIGHHPSGTQNNYNSVLIHAIDSNVKDAKDPTNTTYTYCVRIKWKKVEKELSVYVKRKCDGSDSYFNNRKSISFLSLDEMIEGLDATKHVNWGISAGAAASGNGYQSIQSVKFKNLFIDDPFANMYIDFDGRAINPNISLVYNDNSSTILYPTDDNCDLNITSFENSKIICWEDAKEIFIKGLSNIKVNWYDTNGTLIDANTNRFDIRKNKNYIVNKKLRLQAKLINKNNNNDTIGILDFLINFKSTPVDLVLASSSKGVNIGDSVYVYYSHYKNMGGGEQDEIILDSFEDNNQYEYEILNADTTQFVNFPRIGTLSNKLSFKLDPNNESCYTEFILKKNSKMCKNDKDSIKIKVYKYIQLLFYSNNDPDNSFRLIRTCSGNRLQFMGQHCLSESLKLIYKYDDDTTYYSITDGINTDSWESDNRSINVYIFDENTNKYLDSCQLQCSKEDLAPLYLEEPRLVNRPRINDTCVYVIKGQFSYIDTNKYELLATFDSIPRNLQIDGSSLEFSDTVKLKCADNLSKEYKIDIRCKATEKLMDTIVCSHVFSLNCSCNSCNCDAFNNKVSIKVYRDSAGTLKPLNDTNGNGFATRGKYCKFRINIDTIGFSCGIGNTNFLIHQPSANASGKWQTTIQPTDAIKKIDSLVYLITGPDPDPVLGPKPKLVKDTITISYVASNGDICYKKQPIYCECYAEMLFYVDIIVDNIIPDAGYAVAHYDINGGIGDGINFMIKDSQGNTVNNSVHSLTANSPLSGNFMIDTNPLLPGVYFVIAELNGKVISSQAGTFIKN